jgi:hypothetical protein
VASNRTLDTLRAAIARRRAADPAGFRAGWLLGLVLLGLTIHLVGVDPPWEGGIAERLSKGARVRPRDFAETWGWWAALANAAVALGLLVTRRFWVRGGPVPESPALAPPPGQPSRLVVGLTLCAMLAGAWLAWPRLDQSLWDDEDTALRLAVEGGFLRNPSGELYYRRLVRQDALWDYQKPTNHVPYSLLAQASLRSWRALAKPELPFISERAYRMPAYLAGIAALGATALFVTRLGHPLAGAGAAWILALHPWHLRYASEARGYALVLLLVPLALLAWLNVLHHGTWRRWLGAGGLQFLLLWSFPLAAPFVVVWNATLGVGILVLQRDPGARAQQLARWLVSGVAAAMLVVQMMLPNVMQFAGAVGQRFGGADRDFTTNALAYLLAGMPWDVSRPESFYPHLAAVANAAPAATWAFVAVTLVLLCAGALRLASRGVVHGLLLAVLLLPAPLLSVAADARGLYLYVWYLLFALPGLAGLAALGLTAPFARLPARAATAGSLAALTLYLALLASVTSPAREALRSRSLQPLRESVALTRPVRDPLDPRNAQILTAAFESLPVYYDPRVQRLGNADDLRALMAEADREQRTLFVNFGRLKLVRKRRPEALALVEREDLFEPVATLHGFEPKLTRFVYRYRGQPGS